MAAAAAVGGRGRNIIVLFDIFYSLISLHYTHTQWFSAMQLGGAARVFL